MNDLGRIDGEMENSATISHGCARFLKERFLQLSDSYIVYVCDECGFFAQRIKRADSKEYISPKDTFICPNCKNTTGISKINMPYAAKLLFQELMSMSIVPHIRTKNI